MGSVRRRSSTSTRRSRSGTEGLSLPGFLFWTTFLVSSAIIYLWVYNQTDVANVQIVETNELIQELEHTNRELQANIDNLSQMDRITRIARNQLRMHIPPAESLIVYVSEAQK
jgi:cell division protein FtsL